jgi:hypothetical protein
MSDASEATETVNRRFRLSIDFTARQPLLDFVELLKREELLPKTARPQLVSTLSQVSPAAETYVVVLPDTVDPREAKGGGR